MTIHNQGCRHEHDRRRHHRPAQHDAVAHRLRTHRVGRAVPAVRLRHQAGQDSGGRREHGQARVPGEPRGPAPERTPKLGRLVASSERVAEVLGESGVDANAIDPARRGVQRGVSIPRPTGQERLPGGRCGWSGQNGGWSGSSAGGGRAGGRGGSGRCRIGPAHVIGIPGGSASRSWGSGWGKSRMSGSPRVR
jgi:hypothetical protein